MKPELAEFYRMTADGSMASADPDSAYELVDAIANDPEGVAESFGSHETPDPSDIRDGMLDSYYRTAFSAPSPVLDYVAERSRRLVEDCVLGVSTATGIPASDVASARVEALDGDPATYDSILNLYYG